MEEFLTFAKDLVKQITNTKKEGKFIMYLAENSLYGLGMREYLPYCEFKWLKNVDKFDVNSISENSSTAYILEVDLEYPNELHYLHNDYPLAPEKLVISYDRLSNYCKKIADKYGIKVGDVKKLVPNVRLVNNEKDYLKHVNKQTFISHKIFDKNFVTIHDIKQVLALNKPIYVGFTVLELRK